MWWWLLFGAGVLGVLALLGAMRKAALRDRIGSFPCRLRVGDAGREVSGYLVFGSLAIYVYRSVFVGVRRYRVYPRSSFDMQAQPYKEGEVDVRLGTDNLRVASDVYAAMVAWVDAAGPREEPLL
ncbi:MAG: hypothetical protein Q3999_06510 [Buchananella hordeovulneris]|nr:hypothetical protein [Buchananella hordeovulneris]